VESVGELRVAQLVAYIAASLDRRGPVPVS
jgi:hypothetical protein